MMNGLLSLHKETLLQEVDPARSTLFTSGHLTNSIYAIASYIRAYTAIREYARSITNRYSFMKANCDKGKILLPIYYMLLSTHIRNAEILILRIKRCDSLISLINYIL